MPTSLDFRKATIMAFKNTLEGKSTSEKEKHIAIQIADERSADKVSRDHDATKGYLLGCT